jgi:hypothetical protein
MVFANDAAFNDSFILSFVCNKILENYQYRHHNTFQVTFIYKDKRSLAMISLKKCLKAEFQSVEFDVRNDDGRWTVRFLQHNIWRLAQKLLHQMRTKRFKLMKLLLIVMVIARRR